MPVITVLFLLSMSMCLSFAFEQPSAYYDYNEFGLNSEVVYQLKMPQNVLRRYGDRSECLAGTRVSDVDERVNELLQMLGVPAVQADGNVVNPIEVESQPGAVDRMAESDFGYVGGFNGNDVLAHDQLQVQLPRPENDDLAAAPKMIVRWQEISPVQANEGGGEALRNRRNVSQRVGVEVPFVYRKWAKLLPQSQSEAALPRLGGVREWFDYISQCQRLLINKLHEEPKPPPLQSQRPPLNRLLTIVGNSRNGIREESYTNNNTVPQQEPVVRENHNITKQQTTTNATDIKQTNV